MERVFRRFLDRLFRRQESDPGARIRSVQEEFQEKLAGSKDWLARLAASAGRLEVRIDSSRARMEELRQRLAAYEKVGKTDLAGELRAELRDLEAVAARDSQELGKARSLLKSHRTSLDRLQREFEEKIRRLERLASEVEVKELEAELASLVGVAAREAEDSKTRLSALQEDLEMRHDQAKGRVRVALDLADND